MATKLVETSTFLAADRYRRTHTVRVLTEYEVMTLGDLGERWSPTGCLAYRMSNGEHINKLPDGRFRTAIKSTLLQRL
jgi:hypothetical protein